MGVSASDILTDIDLAIDLIGKLIANIASAKAVLATDQLSEAKRDWRRSSNRARRWTARSTRHWPRPTAAETAIARIERKNKGDGQRAWRITHRCTSRCSPPPKDSMPRAPCPRRFAIRRG